MCVLLFSSKNMLDSAWKNWLVLGGRFFFMQNISLFSLRLNITFIDGNGFLWITPVLTEMIFYEVEFYIVIVDVKCFVFSLRCVPHKSRSKIKSLSVY